MPEELSTTAALDQETPEPAQEQVSLVVAELFLDSHRVVGELQHVGALHRLVDVLNAIDGTFIVVHNGEMDDPHRPNEAPRRLQVIHVHRNAILFAIPKPGAGPAHRPRSFEVVEKVPVWATIVLPGYEITGNVYLPPDVDPIRAPLLSNNRFVPLTDATVVAVQNGGRTREEPLVVINLGRALLWAPQASDPA